MLPFIFQQNAKYIQKDLHKQKIQYKFVANINTPMEEKYEILVPVPKGIKIPAGMKFTKEELKPLCRIMKMGEAKEIWLKLIEKHRRKP